MSTSVAATHRDRYATLWGSVAEYGRHAPGETYVDKFLAMSGATPPALILDAGCGTGKGAIALAAKGFQPFQCDLTAEGLTAEARDLPFTEACLWDDIMPLAYLAGAAPLHMFDYVYCCDVLEHIPPEFTMLVLARLLDPECVRKGAFFSISLVPDQFGVWVGEALHLTVQPFIWWRDHLAELGDVVECRDLLNVGLYFVRPRR